MRTVALVLSFFVFLISGKQTLHANPSAYKNYADTHTIAKSRQLRFESKDQSLTIFEDSDFDNEEDQINTDDFNLQNPFDCSLVFNSLTANWYAAYLEFFIDNPNAKRYNTLSTFCESSTPIYISQRVLRIWFPFGISREDNFLSSA